MRKWTPEERKKQSELIRQWKPWEKGGVKTFYGKLRSSKNAVKHGYYSEEEQYWCDNLPGYKEVHLRYRKAFLGR